MTVAVKQWKDLPDRTTPVNAAGLKDLETRLGSYADSLVGTTTVAADATLTAQANSGASTLTVSTSVPLGYVAIGPFSSSCEIKRIIGVSGSTVTIEGTLASTHANGSRLLFFQGAVSATWFGAKGDGTTDDTAALQAAATASAGHSLLIPATPAFYKVLNAITIPDDTSVVGEGSSGYSPYTAVRSGATTIKKTNANTNADRIFTLGQGCRVAHMDFFGPDQVTGPLATYPAGTNNPSYAIFGSGVAGDHTSPRIVDCSFYYFSQAALGGTMRVGQIVDCHFLANRKGIEWTNGAAGENWIVGGSFTGNIEHAIHASTNALRVTGARIEWNNRYGVWCEGQSATIPIIEGCYFDRNGWAACRFDGSGWVVSGTIFNRNGCGGDGAFGQNATVTRSTATTYIPPATEYDKSHIHVGQWGAHGTIGDDCVFATYGDDNGLGAIAPKYILGVEVGSPNYIQYGGASDSLGWRDSDVSIGGIDPAWTIALTANSSAGANTITVSSAQATNRFQVGSPITITNAARSNLENKVIQAINTGTGVITLTTNLANAHSTGERVYLDGIGTRIYGNPTASGIGAKVYKAADFVHNSSGNWLSVTFDSVRYDPDLMFNTALNTRLTIRKPGIYTITAHLAWAASAAGTLRQVRLVRSGNTIAQETRVPISGAPISVSIATTEQCVIGDYIEIQGYQDTGGSLNISAALYFSPFLSVAINE